MNEPVQLDLYFSTSLNEEFDIAMKKYKSSFANLFGQNRPLMKYLEKKSKPSIITSRDMHMPLSFK